MGQPISAKKLQIRTASAAVLVPVTLFVLWSGGLVFAAMVAALFFVAAYEWMRLTLKMPSYKVPLILGGSLYLMIAFGGFYLLRLEYPLPMCFLFVFLVWFSDVGAYFAGKFFGTAKMAETISPNKTWAGMVGAMAAPAGLAMIYSVVLHLDILQAVYALVFGAIIGISGQAGDLFISFLKRQANVKDTGNLIPGHGGLLDRIDAMMLSMPVFLFLTVVFPHVF